jgi:hypothetical protein
MRIQAEHKSTKDFVFSSLVNKLQICVNEGALTMPWCAKKGNEVTKVDSCPPPWLAVDVNAVTGFPTRAPLAHWAPVLSHSARICVGAPWVNNKSPMRSTKTGKIKSQDKA